MASPFFTGYIIGPCILHLAVFHVSCNSFFVWSLSVTSFPFESLTQLTPSDIFSLDLTKFVLQHSTHRSFLLYLFSLTSSVCVLLHARSELKLEWYCSRSRMNTVVNEYLQREIYWNPVIIVVTVFQTSLAAVLCGISVANCVVVWMLM